MTGVLLVAVGGAAGALLRWLVSRSDSGLPWGMMAANVVASGAAAACVDLEGSWRWVVNVGLLGALSTWSSLAVAAAKLMRDGRTVQAVGVLAGTVAASIAAAVVFL